MSPDKSKDEAKAELRKKVTIGLIAVFALFLAYQMYDMLFAGGGESTPEASAKVTADNGKPTPPKMEAPSKAEVPKATAQTTEQVQPGQMTQQQQMQARYMAYINELQMLKLTRELAETNQAIATAKLATVTAQDGIVKLLAPAPKPSPTEQLSQPMSGAGGEAGVSAGPSAGGAAGAAARSAQQEDSEYTVLSVTKLQNKWGAVIAYQQTLYNVSVGDVLAADGSTVESISSSGVVLSRNGTKRTISMVPII